MGAPLAYFLTWTCYGTWLHGDARGSVDRFHNQSNTPYLREDTTRNLLMHKQQKFSPVLLDNCTRRIVHETIIDHCELRSWPLHAINVRSNHVHVVVTVPTTLLPETAMNQLKAWSTRRLREAECFAEDQNIWTQHGSTRWLTTERSLAGAIRYVLHEQ